MDSPDGMYQWGRPLDTPNQDVMPAEETVWIVLEDGCRLAARLWLPKDTGPVPAILEYLPYRRRDRHRGDDAILHPGFAAAGYAAIRVDMRGSGDSDGTMDDEYTPQEWADTNEVIAWIAAQPWCSGAVGEFLREGRVVPHSAPLIGGA